MRQRFALVVTVALLSVACGVKLPPITVVLDPPKSKPVEPATPAPPPVTPPAVESPATEPAPEPALQNLNVWVLTPSSNPIADARVTRLLVADTRRTDGGGFVNFAVARPEAFDVSALGYFARRVELPPGDHRVHLEAIPEPAKPVPPTKPPEDRPSNLGFPGCGASTNTMAISQGCLEAVAQASKNYPSCQAGDPVACHRYTREVALALRTTQNDAAWGLITKPRGQQACTLTRCGRDVDNGFGEDMVAYLPTGNPVNLWTGLDVVSGAGAPGAKFQGGPLPPATGGRPDNLWAPVP